MKWITFPLALFGLILLLASATFAFDVVDIGNPTSEAGHNLQGWGPIEPANSGGNYGGVTDCRATWFDNGDPNNPDPAWATVDLDFGTDEDDDCLVFVHLAGLADDSFDVFINNTQVFTYTDAPSDQEVWILSFVPVSGYAGINTVKFVATGPAWDGFSTYGQMCFDEVKVEDCAVPNDTNTWGAVKSLYR